MCSQQLWQNAPMFSGSILLATVFDADGLVCTGSNRHPLDGCQGSLSDLCVVETLRPCCAFIVIPSTCVMYRLEVQRCLATMNCPEYFQMVENRITQETERAEAYLDVGTTSAKLLRIVDDVFVSRQVLQFHFCIILFCCQF
jgi:hypothetical protein